ncbi:MAG TPA: hypothetical protein VGV37_29640 [Aliidongia sp.]|uniref:hypothetical protein n=1 Tax=Aliidongia sp. TaxID=1914230 RepID=UPI002DDD53E8|nr:hypothetical protein [Aliidongia sp.]HEV2678727.1 hypothetical protein [Aliidongia sp.]
MIEEIESAIIANDYEIYQRGDWIVRPATMADLPGDAAARTPRIIRAGVNYLTCEFTRCAQWLGWDARSDGWVPKDAPKKIADTYLEMLGKWRVRRLLGVINAPTLRPDGSVLNRPGYDTATAVIFDPDGVTELAPEIRTVG